MSATDGDIDGVFLHVQCDKELHLFQVLGLFHLQVVLAGDRLVGVAVDRLVSWEALGMADTAGDIVGVLLHVGLDGGLHMGVIHIQLVLVQPDLVCAGWHTTLGFWEDSLGCALVEADSSRALVLVGLGTVLAL